LERDTAAIADNLGSDLYQRGVKATSVVGYKQTSSGPKSKSALPPKADIPRLTLDFRF